MSKTSQKKQKMPQISLQNTSYTFDVIKNFLNNLGQREIKLIKSNRMKKFLRIDQKTIYSQQIYELVSNQMYNHLANIYKRQINALLTKHKVKEALQIFDYFLFRSAIMDEIKQQVWNDFDQEEQFLEQLEKELDIMYEEV